MAGTSILGVYNDNTGMDTSSSFNDNVRNEEVSTKTQIIVENLPTNTSEEDLRELFSKYGSSTEVYLDCERASIKMDNHSKAAMAKSELNGTDFNGRQIVIRMTSTNRAAIRVDNLSPVISNELLKQAMSQFGEINTAVVVVDNEGRSTSRGIVQFNSEESAHRAVQKIQEGYFLITSSPRVVSADLMDQTDCEVGLPDQKLTKTTEYYSEREFQPRFAEVGTFEADCAKAWKARLNMEREQRAKFERSLKESREIFESEMEICQLEHRTLMKKQDLIRRQEEQRKSEFLEESLFVMPNKDFNETDQQINSSQSSSYPRPTTEKATNRDMNSSWRRASVGNRFKKVKRPQRLEPRSSLDSLARVEPRSSMDSLPQRLEPRSTSDSLSRVEPRSTLDSLLVLSNNPLHDDVTSDDGIEQDAIGSSDNSGSRLTTNSPHTTTKPHKCPFCPKRYYQKGNMRRHMRIHSQATQHKCEVCHKLFATRWEKNRHVSKKCSNHPRSTDMGALGSPQLPSMVPRPQQPSTSSNHSNIILPY